MTTVNGMGYRDWLAACPPDPRMSWTRCPTCKAPLRSDGTACTGRERHPQPARQIIYYATWTQTRANLEAMNRAGIRLITGPDQLERGRSRPGQLPPLSWALDNGAWGCFRGGRAWDEGTYRTALDRWGDGADWAVAPDVVAGGLASLELSLRWVEALRRRVGLVLLAVQDGMQPEHLSPHLDAQTGIFVGGSTEWKWATLESWAQLAKSRGAYLHVGRVNSAAAIARCIRVGANSADGTSPSMYSCNADKIHRATQRPAPLELPWSA